MLLLSRQICQKLASSKGIILTKMAFRSKITRKSLRDLGHLVIEAKVVTEVVKVKVVTEVVKAKEEEEEEEVEEEEEEEALMAKEPALMKVVVEAEEEAVVVMRIDLKNLGARPASTAVKKIILPETAQLQRKRLVRKLKVHQERKERESQEHHPLRPATSATRLATSPKSALRMFKMSATTAINQAIWPRIAQTRPQERTRLQESQESKESQESLEESQENEESLESQEKVEITRRITRRAKQLTPRLKKLFLESHSMIS